MENIDPESVLSTVRLIDPDSFEQLISDIWEYIGYNTEVTASVGDKGIDIVATRDFPYEETILIQAKRYGAGSTLSGPEMQKYGRLSGKDGVDTVLVISTGGFTKQAREIAEEEEIKCIGGNTLANLVLREGLVDLVESYAEGDSVQTPKQKRSPDSPDTKESEQSFVVGEGDCLEIEVVGFDNRYIEFEDRDENIHEERKYTVICMYVRNKTDYEWNFFGYNHLAVTASDGFSYDNHQDNSWSSRSGQYTPWNNGKNHDIKPNSKSRIVVIYKTWFDPEKIEYTTKLLHSHGDDNQSDGKERITIHMDESIREKLNSLPESLPIDQICLN
ncbi:restriction endonuclease [Haloferax elongans ATCC BAA-1513]|uniref:Restriction endonuclease n=1 Tax=Haloferax elongans ATCC BAA-1513 TaxID=1230453 RepID=M0HDH0_HALEO|nr:restriction endonuclease [Haloferax elongans]ELZ81787.1 restriction endonuclease [Haloferax elongans ATCC BAA-1513]